MCIHVRAQHTVTKYHCRGVEVEVSLRNCCRSFTSLSVRQYDNGIAFFAKFVASLRSNHRSSIRRDVFWSPTRPQANRLTMPDAPRAIARLSVLPVARRGREEALDEPATVIGRAAGERKEGDEHGVARDERRRRSEAREDLDDRDREDREAREDRASRLALNSARSCCTSAASACAL